MEHTRKFNGNLNLICEDLRRIEQASGRSIIHCPPKLLSEVRNVGRDKQSEVPPTP